LQKRVRDFDSGIAMIVTDLHGEGDVYEHLRDTFLDLRIRGDVDRLIFCGDLIHGYGDEASDASIDMLLDVMRLQAELGEDAVTMLLGNHEFPHIYSITLSKGDLEFTSRFEQALMRLDKNLDGFSRDDVITFLRWLPFYVRTKSGVLLTHAGASPAIKSDDIAGHVLDFEHEKLLDLGDELLAGYSIDLLRNSREYCLQAKHYLGIDDVDDPRFTDLLRGNILSQTSPDFQLLWDVLFATNENGLGLDLYELVVEAFLKHISALSQHEQEFIVAGHIGAKDGAAAIGSRHLRLASYAHAKPAQSGKYLLLDCEKPIQSMDELMRGLRPVFD